MHARKCDREWNRFSQLPPQNNAIYYYSPEKPLSIKDGKEAGPREEKEDYSEHQR